MNKTKYKKIYYKIKSKEKLNRLSMKFMKHFNKI